METINNILNTNLFSIGEYNLLLKQLLLSLIIIIVAWILFRTAKHSLKTGKLIKRLSIKNASSLIRFLRLLFFIIAGVTVIQVLGFNVKAVLQYKIISTEHVSFNLFNLIILLIIFFITKLVLYLIELIFEDNVRTNKIDKGKGQSLFQIVKYLIWVVAITLFMESLGFSITLLIASLSALLVGLGLGVQHFFNDIISGIVILFDHSIKVGDIVEIQDSVVGKIEEISLRTSKIISRDDVIIIVPNSKFTADNVINWSHNSLKTRFGVKIGVAYGSDVDKVKSLLIEAAKEHPEITDYPEPMVYFRDFGESSLDFELLFMTEESFRVERIKSDLRFTINKKFAENGITIPFPQRDVHFYNTKQ